LDKRLSKDAKPNNTKKKGYLKAYFLYNNHATTDNNY